MRWHTWRGRRAHSGKWLPRSQQYRSRLANEGIAVSMSRKGNCWGNAVAESFFASLKNELIYRRSWTLVLSFVRLFLSTSKSSTIVDDFTLS